MKRLLAAAIALSVIAPALADQHPGHQQQGYEGQPGNQSSGG